MVASFSLYHLDLSTTQMYFGGITLNLIILFSLVTLSSLLDCLVKAFLLTIDLYFREFVSTSFYFHTKRVNNSQTV